MSKFRYARSNGQFLNSKFVNPVVESSDQSFRTDQSYDLNSSFVSSSVGQSNSFVTGSKVLGYQGTDKSVLAWWRLGNVDTANTFLVDDSSGNNIVLTGSAGTAPTLDLTDTPTSFINKNSFLFDGSDDFLRVTSSKIKLGTGQSGVAGGTDFPISFSAWFKVTAAAENTLLYVTTAAGGNVLYIKASAAGGMVFSLFDPDGHFSLGSTANSLVSVDTWHHVVATYDGRGGEKAYQGMNIYLDSQKLSIAGSNNAYDAMTSSSPLAFTVGRAFAATWPFNGNIAEAALIGKELTQTEVSHLYGVKKAGAYRLVREFSRESVDNDTMILGIGAERRGIQTADVPDDIMNQYRQGVNVVTHQQLSDYNAFRIRPNSSFVNTLRGEDIPTSTFNDELGTTSFKTGVHASAAIGATSTAWTEGAGNNLKIIDGRGVTLIVTADVNAAAGTVQKVSPAAEKMPSGALRERKASATPFVPAVYSIGVQGAVTIALLTEALHDLLVLAKNNGDIMIASTYVSSGPTVVMTQLNVGPAGNTEIEVGPHWGFGGSGFSGGAITSGPSNIVIGGDGKLSSRLSHYRERRDLGQSEIYDNSVPYEDTLDLNPLTIVARRPENVILPYQLVIQTSNEIYDGTIEPLVLRGQIDRSAIDWPFYAHDVRSSLGGMTDPFRRSYVIVDGKDLDETAKGAAPFLDSQESFGTLDVPGAFSDDFATIEPYVDYLNDRDKEYTTNSVSSTIATVIIEDCTWVDNDERTYDKMASRGFVFDNDPIGFDSIVYGGLKK